MKYLLLTLSLFILTNSARAQLTVYDPANHAENILSAIRTLQSNLNEAKMIINQIKDLTKLDLNLQSDFAESLHALFTEMGKVHGLMQDLATLDSKFEELYKDFNNDPSAVALKVMRTALEEALDESREMMRGAAHTGALVLENLPKAQAHMDTLLTESSLAIGNLQAQQTGNQLIGSVNSNILHLNALLANYSQAHMSYLQRLNSDEAAVQNRMDHVLRGASSTSSATPAKLQPY